MPWRLLTKASEFADFLCVPMVVLQRARRQRSYAYVEEDRIVGKNNKLRHLCYPPRESELRRVQTAIKDRCFSTLALSDAVCGYRKKMHNVNCAQKLAGFPFVAKLDIADFHPSITPELVTKALLSHGVSHPMCRIVTQLVTYNFQVPQGAPTSNHVANLVVDFVLKQGVLRECESVGVAVANYGDDTGFGGMQRQVVDSCLLVAVDTFRSNGLEVNIKTSAAEHVGAARGFIGTATGRQKADLPRKKFRGYRKEFRQALRAERVTSNGPVATEKDIKSIRAKIGYVGRLNRRKSRALKEISFRLCAVRRSNIAKRGSELNSSATTPS